MALYNASLKVHGREGLDGPEDRWIVIMPGPELRLLVEEAGGYSRGVGPLCERHGVVHGNKVCSKTEVVLAE